MRRSLKTIQASAARWVHTVGAERSALSPDSTPEISPSVCRVILWKHLHTEFGMHPQKRPWGFLFNLASRSTGVRKDCGLKQKPATPPHSYAA
jgi:hypothetical protein